MPTKSTKKTQKPYLETRTEVQKQQAYFTMVLEDLRSNFKIYGELHQETDKKVSRLFDLQEKSNQKIEQLFDLQNKTNEKVDKLSDNVDQITKSIGQLFIAQQVTNSKLDDFIVETRNNFKEVDKRFETTDKKVDEIQKELYGFKEETKEKFEKIDSKFDEVDNNFKFISGIMMRVEEKVDDLAVNVKRLETDKADVAWVQKLKTRIAN